MSLVSTLTREQCNVLYNDVLIDEDHGTIKDLCKIDLFFLLTRMCKRTDIDRQWLFERIREVEKNPNGHLDLWPREHYKSTILTYGKTIQDILNNPEITVGIFSHVKPISKAFLRQIKVEFEENVLLKAIFNDVLYEQPQKESPCWSLDSGITVKRSSNPKEQTVEANGLVDGQPTSKHYKLMVYDDVVTLESVSTPEQIKKVTNAWAMSLNLGAEGGHQRYIGTRYHTNDTYKEMMRRGSVTPRIYTATHDGTDSGEPVFLSKEILRKKRRDMGPYIFASQMLQDPTADKAQGFKEEWLRYWNAKEYYNLNIYILCDPANAKKKTSDYTVFWVVGLGRDNNYYAIDCVRDRLSLTERAEILFELHRYYKPIDVGYEQYGMQADIEHIEYMMEKKNYRFDIIPLGGQMAKEDRIKMLVPVYEQGRFYLPRAVHYVTYEGKTEELISSFVEDEYLTFPVSAHDDMLDGQARILDPVLGAEFPEYGIDSHEQETAENNYAYF